MYGVSLPHKDFVFQFASFLLKSNSLRFGVFTLASGKQSAYYIDLRVLPSFPGYFRLGISALKDVVAEKVGRFDVFASVPTSGLVFGSALAYEMNKPFIYVRKDPKTYGTNKMIEIIRANGGTVEDVVALVDRHEGAEVKLKKMGVKLSSVIGINGIVNALYNAGLIDENALESVLKQMVTQGEYETD